MILIFRNFLIFSGFLVLLSCSTENPLPPLQEARFINSNHSYKIPKQLDSLGIRLQFLRTNNAEKEIDYAVTLNNIAEIYARSKDFPLALHFYERSIKQFGYFPEQFELEYLRVYQNYISLKRDLILKPQLNEIKQYLTLLSKSDNSIYSEMEYCFNFLIAHYIKNDNIKHALYYQQWKVRKYQENPIPTESVTDSVIRELLYDLALLYYQTGDIEMASASLNKIELLLKKSEYQYLNQIILSAKIARKEKGILRSINLYKQAEKLAQDKMIYLDIIYFGLAENYFVLRKYKESENYLLKSLAISEQFYGINSEPWRNRIKLLKKNYDFSAQYEKLKNLD